MATDEQSGMPDERLEELRGKVERGEELTPEEETALRDAGVEPPPEGAPPAL